MYAENLVAQRTAWNAYTVNLQGTPDSNDKIRCK